MNCTGNYGEHLSGTGKVVTICGERGREREIGGTEMERQRWRERGKQGGKAPQQKIMPPKQ